MRNYGYLYLKDDEVQRVVRLWRPNLYRTDDSETPGEWGAHAGGRSMPAPKSPESGALRCRGWHAPSLLAGSPGDESGQDSGADGGGKLKT